MKSQKMKFNNLLVGDTVLSIEYDVIGKITELNEPQEAVIFINPSEGEIYASVWKCQRLDPIKLQKS